MIAPFMYVVLTLTFGYYTDQDRGATIGCGIAFFVVVRREPDISKVRELIFYTRRISWTGVSRLDLPTDPKTDYL